MAARLGLCMGSADNSLIRKKKASDVKMDDHTTKAKQTAVEWNVSIHQQAIYGIV
jgi:hypothetical protein